VISAVVLAAARFQSSGEPNFFMPLRGKPVVQWVLESALAADLDEIICVTRELKSVQKHIQLADERLFWLLNYGADRGQSTSVITGLWATHPNTDGVMFLAGDQPLIRTKLINSLIERFTESSAWIVAPSFNGRARHPLLVRRDLFPELLQLNGDRDTRALLEKHRQKTVLVEWPDEISFLALDVRENYERIKEFV
jgi:molybdenum cofactor cytidylyltransferase